MRRRGTAFIALPVAALIGLTACAPSETNGREDTPVTETSSPSALSWEQAKASTQAIEREIVGLIPPDQVAQVDQQETGSLFSCSDGRHAWLGGVTVTLTPGVSAEHVVRRLEAHFTGGRFDVRTRRDIDGEYEVQLVDADGEANFIFSRWEADDTLSIDSASSCFTLPEGVYPGGDF